MADDQPPIIAAIALDEDLTGLPDPNGNPAMTGNVLPDDWTPDGDR